MYQTRRRLLNSWWLHFTTPAAALSKKDYGLPQQRRRNGRKNVLLHYFKSIFINVRFFLLMDRVGKTQEFCLWRYWPSNKNKWEAVSSRFHWEHKSICTILAFQSDFTLKRGMFKIVGKHLPPSIKKLDFMSH